MKHEGEEVLGAAAPLEPLLCFQVCLICFFLLFFHFNKIVQASASSLWVKESLCQRSMKGAATAGQLLQHQPEPPYQLCSLFMCRRLSQISVSPFFIFPMTASICSSWVWPRRSRICTEKSISRVSCKSLLHSLVGWPAQTADSLRLPRRLSQRRRSTTWRASWRSTASRCPPSARSAASWPMSCLWTRLHVRDGSDDVTRGGAWSLKFDKL